MVIIEILDRVSIVAGVLSFVIMTVAFRLLAILVHTESQRFRALAQVFNALAVMAGVFILTAALSPLYPDYAWLWRLAIRPPIIGVTWELVRFFWSRREEHV